MCGKRLLNCVSLLVALWLPQVAEAQVCPAVLFSSPYIFDRAVLPGTRVQFETSSAVPNGQWFFNG